MTSDNLKRLVKSHCLKCSGVGTEVFMVTAAVLGCKSTLCETRLVLGNCKSSTYPCGSVHNSRGCANSSGKTALISSLYVMETYLFIWQMMCWCQIESKTNISCGNVNTSCIVLCLSLFAVEKLIQMDGCKKPHAQKRCEAGFGIQTTKKECGLMKETKIKHEPYSL